MSAIDRSFEKGQNRAEELSFRNPSSVGNLTGRWRGEVPFINGEKRGSGNHSVVITRYVPDPFKDINDVYRVNGLDPLATVDQVAALRSPRVKPVIETGTIIYNRKGLPKFVPDR